MNNMISEGKTLNYTAGADIASGGVVDLDTCIGIAVGAIANGATGAVQMEGVFELPKAAGAIGQGALVYWTGTAITTTPTENTPAGKAWAGAESADSTVLVKING